MSKYTVTHTCGHDQTYNLTGPRKNREWRIEKLEGECCANCAAAARTVKYAAESAVNAEQAASTGLPALTGSAKQIAWAETIRAKLLGDIKPLDKIEMAIRLSPFSILEIEDAFFLMTDEIKNQTESKWFIDNRELKTDLGAMLVRARTRGLIPLAVAETEVMLANKAAISSAAKAEKDAAVAVAVASEDSDYAAIQRLNWEKWVPTLADMETDARGLISIKVLGRKLINMGELGTSRSGFYVATLTRGASLFVRVPAAAQAKILALL